jgi:putative transposase
MPQKRHTVDQIVAKLRKADVELGKGKKVPEVCKLLEITEQTYYLKTNFNLSKKTVIHAVLEAGNGT